MSGLFKSKKEEPEVSVVADPYSDVRNPLNKWLNSQIGQPGPKYTGEFVAPESQQETQSYKYLNDYANRGTPSSFTAGKKVVEDTLKGEYDPTKSPYYQAIKAESMRNLKDTQADISDQAAGGGGYWTGARLDEQRSAATDVANNLNKVMGDLSLQERQNQLSMVPMAANYAQTEENQPLNTVAALRQYGALPRELQQAYDQALYNDFLQSQYQWPMNIGQLAAGVQQAPMYGQTSYRPSAFDSYVNPMLQSATSAALMAAFMSSKKLKKNISDIPGPLEKVKKLRGVVFDWKDSSMPDGGVIAEEVEQILPAAVVEINGVKHIKPMMIIGYLIEALKELLKKVEASHVN